MNATMTDKEAQAHIIAALARCSVAAPNVEVYDIDEVVTWTARVTDVDTGETGWASFDEHYGEVDVTWGAE